MKRIPVMWMKTATTSTKPSIKKGPLCGQPGANMHKPLFRTAVFTAVRSAVRPCMPNGRSCGQPGALTMKTAARLPHPANVNPGISTGKEQEAASFLPGQPGADMSMTAAKAVY